MRKLKISKNMILLIIMFIAIMIMGIGYASIESVTGEIEGKVIADAQSGVFITDVEYLSDIDASLPGCQIDNFLGTMLNSTINLSKVNPTSEIKYKVTVYNSSTETVPFVGVVYDDDFYDNPDIIFEITKEGFQIGQTINPGETKEVYITFKYKNTTTGIMPENTVLKSYLNFKMAEPNRMILATNSTETENYLKSTVSKEKIESIKFEQGKEPEYSEKIIERFDASEKQDESIIGYYTDTDSNGLYELTFVSQEIIYSNKSGKHLFADLSNVKSIEFNNFSTLGILDTYAMFSKCINLKELDLSCFDTSKTTNMSNMFINCIELTSIDISNFNTKNVTTMLAMFHGCKKLQKLDISVLDTSNVNAFTFMFLGCSSLSELDVSKFDTNKATTFSCMFQYCKNLKKLDVSNFYTEKVINMSSMFSRM